MSLPGMFDLDLNSSLGSWSSSCNVGSYQALQIGNNLSLNLELL